MALIRNLILYTLILAAASTLAAPRKPKNLSEKFFFKPDIEDARVSPGNHSLSFIGNNGQRALFSHDFETGKRRSIKAERGNQIYDYYWVSPDQVIVFAEKLGIPAEVFSVNRRLSAVEPCDYVQVYDLMPDTPDRILIKDTDKSEKFFDLELFNLDSGSRKRVAKNPGHVISWITDKNGFARIRQWVDEDENDRFEYRLNEKAEWKEIHLGTDSFGILFLNEPEKVLSFHRPAGKSRVIAQAFDCARNEFYGPIIEDSDYDLIPETFILDPETEDTFGFRYQSDRRRTIWFKHEHHAIQEKINAAFPHTLNDIQGFALDETHAVIRRHSDRNPGIWLLFEIDTGHTKLIGKERPWIDPAETASTQSITFPNREGTPIHALLTQPPNGVARKGLLTMIHGGPRARDYWDWDSEAQYFAALGYTVLKINYRGSSEYGLEYSPYSHLEAIQNSVVDVADGVRWAIDEGFSKSSKTAIYGSSFGGHVALRTAAEYPELFSCVIGYAGVYDWVKEMDREFAKEPIYWKLKQFKYYGDYDNEKELWQNASAVTLADKIQAPVYLLHGGADEIVASRQSRLMHKALKNAGKNVTLKILSFNNHGMVSERPTIRFYENLAKFIGSTL